MKIQQGKFSYKNGTIVFPIDHSAPRRLPMPKTMRSATFNQLLRPRETLESDTRITTTD
ncbi:MAG: hypothetical protein GY801_45700 [bacterium]|nr:hypothetical protein [bacterium]